MARMAEDGFAFQPVAVGSAEQRAAFIVRTYVHLFSAVAAFTLLLVMYFRLGLADRIAPALAGNWLIVLGGFLLVNWLGSRAAMQVRSMGLQYLALLAVVAAESLIFVPLVWVARAHAPEAIASAAYVTLAGFTVLTLIVVKTRKDFSFLRSVLTFGGFAALGLIVLSLLMGFSLGVFFSVAMVAFAGAAILYDTSNVLHHYPEDRHVAASLALFTSVALLFWYVLRVFLRRD